MAFVGGRIVRRAQRGVVGKVFRESFARRPRVGKLGAATAGEELQGGTLPSTAHSLAWHFEHSGREDAAALYSVMRTPSFSDRLGGADWDFLGAPLFQQVSTFLLDGLPIVPGDFPSVRAAVEAGCSTIALQPFYKEYEQVQISGNVRIVSDGAQLHGCLTVEIGASLTLEGVTVTGPGSGVIVRELGHAAFQNCKVEGNGFYGIIAEHGAKVELSRCVVRNNGMRGVLDKGHVSYMDTDVSDNGCEDSNGGWPDLALLRADEDE